MVFGFGNGFFGINNFLVISGNIFYQIVLEKIKMFKPKYNQSEDSLRREIELYCDFINFKKVSYKNSK